MLSRKFWFAFCLVVLLGFGYASVALAQPDLFFDEEMEDEMEDMYEDEWDDMGSYACTKDEYFDEETGLCELLCDGDQCGVDYYKSMYDKGELEPMRPENCLEDEYYDEEYEQCFTECDDGDCDPEEYEEFYGDPDDHGEWMEEDYLENWKPMDPEDCVDDEYYDEEMEHCLPLCDGEPCDMEDDEWYEDESMDDEDWEWDPAMWEEIPNFDPEWDWFEEDECDDDEECFETEEFELPDIEDYDWGESIDFLFDNGIVEGHPSGNYEPGDLITRAAFSKIVAEAAFTNAELAAAKGGCFPDVKPDDWFGPPMCALKQAGAIQGRPDGKAYPGDTINQAEALKIVLETFFDDIDPVEGEWFLAYLEEAEEQGMFYFEPDNAGAHPLTRGEMAYFIAWILDEDGVDQIDPALFGEEYAYEDDYGWEEMTPEDCLEDEYFDEEDQACYVVCEESDVCDDEFFDGGEFASFFDDFGHDDDFGLDDVEAAVIYDVSGNTITLRDDSGAVGNPDFQDTAVHKAIWKRFTELVPAVYRDGIITEFHVFTDGPEGNMAFVDSTTQDGQNWVLGVDFMDAGEPEDLKNNRELSLTLLHEYAHILTLNNKQIVWSDDPSNCSPQYGTDEGCAEANAYLNLFFKKFWGGKLHEKREQILKRSGDDDYGDEEASIQLYQQHGDQFVSEYAASNPEEDIAESFSHFVVKEKPTGTTVKDKKLLFFYDFPALVKLRTAMRQQL